MIYPDLISGYTIPKCNFHVVSEEYFVLKSCREKTNDMNKISLLEAANMFVMAALLAQCSTFCAFWICRAKKLPKAT